MSDIIVKESRINPEFKVFIVYKEHESYASIKQSLELLNNSIAAIDLQSKSIFIDGERVIDELIDEDQLLAIEAHEVAHYMLGHDVEINDESEKEADLFAIAMLDQDGWHRASSFLKDRLKEFYGIDYSAFEQEWEESLSKEEE